MGTGNIHALLLSIFSYKYLLCTLLDALAHAKETPKIELAPSLDLLFVPSKLIIDMSIPFWSWTSCPINFFAIMLLILETAFKTPFPV